MGFIQWAQGAKTKVVTAVMVGITAVVTSTATAQVDVPPDLGEIVFPINLTSIASSVAAAGATMIGLWAIYKIGFRLVQKFISRMGRAV